MQIFHRVKREVAGVAALLMGAALFFGMQPTTAANETLVGQGPAPANIPGTVLIHGDIGEGDNATDVGDAWFRRLPDPNKKGAELMSVDIQVPNGSVTDVHLCLQTTPIKAPIDKCQYDFKGNLPGNGNEFALNVPVAFQGKPIYAQLAVLHNGVYGFANRHRLWTPFRWGNTYIPPLGYTGPRDICPADPHGTTLNQVLRVNGKVVNTLMDLPDNAKVDIAFTIAPGCENKTVSLAYWHKQPGPLTTANIKGQVLVENRYRMDFTQKADVKDYQIYHLSITHIDNCSYQVDMQAAKTVTPPDNMDEAQWAGYTEGGKDCRVKPTTTTTSTSTSSSTTSTTHKPATTTSSSSTTVPETPTSSTSSTTTTEPPSTTTTSSTSTSTTSTTIPEVEPTIVINTSTSEPATTTTTQPQVLGVQETNNLPRTGGQVIGLVLMGAGTLTAGGSLRRFAKRRN